MDQKLLEILSNLSESLTHLAEVLNEKSESKSATATALQSGDFSKQIIEISNGIKSIKNDTTEILKNQQTILEMSKSKNKSPFEQAGADPKQENNIKKGASVIVLIAGAVLAIGLAFKLIGHVDFASVLSVGIAIAAISLSFERVAKLNLSTKQAAVASGTLIMIAAALTISSYILSGLIPIGINKGLTAIFIAATFAIIGFSFVQIAEAVSLSSKFNIKPYEFVITLVAISTAITSSSYILSLVQPIGIWQFLTALGITALFAVMSYFMDKLAIGVTIIEKFLGTGKLFLIPLIMTAISVAIMLSSQFLSQTADIPLMLLFKIVIMGAALSAISLIMTLPIIALGLVGPATVGLGAIGVVLIAGSIALSSYLLSKGVYENAPSLPWALGAGSSILGFGLSALVLGGFILATGGFGLLAIAAGSAAVLMISSSIVESAKIFKKGGDVFKGGPTKEWADAVGKSIGAFSPVYNMLVANKIMSIFGGGIGPEDFKKAIRTISQGIVDAATFFKGSDGKVFTGGPNEIWADGVGRAIGAFSPVYQVLADNSGWFTSGVSVEDMSKAIQTISRGIVDAANFFNSPENNGVFDISRVPSKEWTEGVGGALGAFSPIFDAIKNKSWFSSGSGVISNMRKAIEQVSMAIVNSSRILTWGKFNNYINPNYIKSITPNIIDYMSLVDKINNFNDRNRSNIFYDPISKVVTGMVKLSNGYDMLARSINNFSNSINRLDVVKLSQFRSLTGNLAVLSTMDSTMFSNMLNVLERRSSMFGDILKSDLKENVSSLVRNPNLPIDKKLAAIHSSTPDKSENELQKLDKIVVLLSTIYKEMSGLDEYLMLSASKIDKNTDIHS